MRIIFMGTPDFSVGTLEALVDMRLPWWYLSRINQRDAVKRCSQLR